MADIVLLSPSFTTSYWGFEYAMPIFGVKSCIPVAGLPLIAAVTPPEHTVTIISEEVEEIDWGRCKKADIVGLTGMSVQRWRMREILTELKRLGCFTVVGGAWVSIKEDYFDGLADVIFVGEAEESWPQFLDDWKKGQHKRHYEQAEKTDMTKVPVPRFDLMKMDRFAWGSLQISRGCPFSCEFCDIIVTFGRKPRLKRSEQVIAELDNLLALGKRDVFIVDDNLIGNRKEIGPILKDIADWQRQHGHAMQFFTEATIDLGDEPELLHLMSEAGISGLFVGVETPSEAGLREVKKHQNLANSNGTMMDKIRRIHDGGIEIYTGMIVGFDSDDATIFQRQLDFISEGRIVNAMISLLCALPKTPLYTRLEAAGRLDLQDEQEFGTNILPIKMTREQLRDGYLRVLSDLYDPENYFDRLDTLYLSGGLTFKGRARYYNANPLRKLKLRVRQVVESVVVFMRVMRVAEPVLKKTYKQRFLSVLKKLDPQLWHIYATRCAMHYHYYRMTVELKESQTGIFNTY